MRVVRVTTSIFGEAVLTLLAASIGIFIAIHSVPGGFVDFMVPPQTPENIRKQIIHNLGLDQSLPLQYWAWLKRVVRGDFGISLISHQPVLQQLGDRAAVTAELAFLAIVYSIVIGVSLGLLSGVYARRRSVSLSSRFLGAAGLSVPDFVIGTILVYFFSIYHLGLTVGQYVPFVDDPWNNLRGMILPAITLGTFISTLTMRTTRDSVLGVLSEPYITASIARGTPSRSIIRRHILRNAANPVITIVAINVAALLGGALIVETIFSLPGIGQYMVQAVQTRDYAVVQAGVLISVAIFVFFNSLADFLYGVVDPRTRGVRGR
jgi:peptide/nickel transport system permease protein